MKYLIEYFNLPFSFNNFIGHYMKENTLLGTGREAKQKNYSWIYGTKSGTLSINHGAGLTNQTPNILDMFLTYKADQQHEEIFLSALQRLCFRTILTGDSSIMANEACRQPSQTG